MGRLGIVVCGAVALACLAGCTTGKNVRDIAQAITDGLERRMNDKFATADARFTMVDVREEELKASLDAVRADLQRDTDRLQKQLDESTLSTDALEKRVAGIPQIVEKLIQDVAAVRAYMFEVSKRLDDSRARIAAQLDDTRTHVAEVRKAYRTLLTQYDEANKKVLEAIAEAIKKLDETLPPADQVLPAPLEPPK